MYRISLHDIVGTELPEKFLFSAKPTSWSKRINAAGRMIFTMPRWGSETTDSNLQKYKRVKLWRKKRDGSGEYAAVWVGYIESHKAVDDSSIEVLCPGMLDYFRKRDAGDTRAMTGQGSTEAFDLLDDTNSDDTTGVTQGTGGVTTTKNITATKIDVLRAWELLAQAHVAEFEINESFVFNFIDSLGTDQSSVINLVFRRDGTPGNTVLNYEDGEDGRDMANRIIADTAAGGGHTTTVDDAASQAIYGVLTERVTIGEANDAGTLGSMASQLLTQRASPIRDNLLQPIMAEKRLNVITGEERVVGLDVSDFSIGDLVNTRIITENITISNETRRIAEFSVGISENGKEIVAFTLTEAGVFVTAAALDFEQERENRRLIKQLQALVS